MFITFEGIDFSGKSTQALLFYNHLKRYNKKAILLREPGGTIVSEKIRKILLDKRLDNMTYLSEFLLFSASRQQLTSEIILPHLKKGYIVVCDRYYDSSTAYQGFGGKIELKTVEIVNKIASDGLVPDRTYLMNITLGDMAKRKSKQNERDRIEKRKADYYKKVIKGYLKIASENKKRFLVLDAAESKALIHNKILEDFKKISSHKKI
ncbi:MAG TPA: dTMP kinase [Ignavibacteria bacterium]|nr:dTMP kinase [Ignavibacteria bacterium]